MAAFTLAGFSLAFFGIKGCGREDDAFFGAGFDGGDVGVGADFDAFGLEVGGPVTVESLKMRESDHLGKVGKEGLRVVVPKLHVGIVEQTFKDCT